MKTRTLQNFEMFKMKGGINPKKNLEILKKGDTKKSLIANKQKK